MFQTFIANSSLRLILRNELARSTLKTEHGVVGLSVLIPILVAVVPPAFAAIFGVITYRRQKRVDRQNYAAEKETDRKIELRNRRMKEYERYLTAYRGYTFLYDFDPPPAENDANRIKAVIEYWLAYSNLFQIASDPVLVAVSDFHKLGWMQDTDLISEAYDEEFKNLYATMIIEMRRDAFEKTDLQKELVEERLPFNFSEANRPTQDTTPTG
jgi:hypothetical protein